MSNSYMLDKRSVGRPIQRPDSETGYNAVVHATQQFLRSPDMSLNRRGIASSAGVSPALVTYYFGHNGELLRDASEAIVVEYLRSMLDIVQSDNLHLNAKLRSLVLVALTAGRRDGRLIDRYFDYFRTHVEETPTAGLLELSNCLKNFLLECNKHDVIKFKDSSVFWVALWGACKYVAQSEDSDATLVDEHSVDPEVLAHQADLIGEIFALR